MSAPVPEVAFWVEDVLRYGDLDRNGHVNNAAFAVFLESSRVGFADAELAPVLPPDAWFVLARLAIDFRAELFVPGRVRTATWVERIGRTSLAMRQRIHGDAGLAAEAEAVVVVMDGATRRPLELPAAARAAAARRLVPPEGRTD